MDQDPTRLSMALSASGLQRIQPDIQRLMQPSIRLASSPASGPIPPGSSRLGGEPDLPAAFTWPSWHGAPMSFLAQVRLDDLGVSPTAALLPRNGLLSFFYDASQTTYGADPSDRGGWLVAWSQGDPATWQPRPFPPTLPAAARFAPCRVTFATEGSLPVSPSQHLPALDWSETEVKGYEDFLYNYPGPQDRAALHHRILGHPDQLQDDMQLQCALYANGFTSLDDPGAAEAIAHKGDWLLLLQLDSDTQARMRWASSGRLYFWIERSALQARQFERCWAVLQSG